MEIIMTMTICVVPLVQVLVADKEIQFISSACGK